MTAVAPEIQMPATLDDLLRVEGRAELIDGRIVPMMPVGDLPGEVAFNIARSLHVFVKAHKLGVVHADAVGYAVPKLKSGRQSFSPDVSFYGGKRSSNRMRFINGPPTLAVEVRSESDFGIAAEIALAAKRADYFEAGTQVVWDVDPTAKIVVRYQASAPEYGVTFRMDEVADAEPALRGLHMETALVFEEQW